MSTGSEESAPLVVIVDDEVDIAVYLRLALEEHGYRVAAFSDAGSAAAALETSQPAAICLDLLMPEKSGLSLYKKIVEDPHLKTCPVLIISGLAVGGDLPLLLAKAGDLPTPAAFIDKPIDMGEFLSTLDSLLARTTGMKP
jgi:CheY-like chemotaxis protein